MDTREAAVGILISNIKPFSELMGGKGQKETTSQQFIFVKMLTLNYFSGKFKLFKPHRLESICSSI